MSTVNLGLLARVDAGRTSLTERLLHAVGAIDKIGSVDEGSTQTDSLALERSRGITIKAAVVSFEVAGVAVNLINIPGHPDFAAEVESAERARRRRAGGLGRRRGPGANQGVRTHAYTEPDDFAERFGGQHLPAAARRLRPRSSHGTRRCRGQAPLATLCDSVSDRSGPDKRIRLATDLLSSPLRLLMAGPDEEALLRDRKGIDDIKDLVYVLR